MVVEGRVGVRLRTSRRCLRGEYDIYKRYSDIEVVIGCWIFGQGRLYTRYAGTEDG